MIRRSGWESRRKNDSRNTSRSFRIVIVRIESNRIESGRKFMREVTPLPTPLPPTTINQQATSNQQRILYRRRYEEVSLLLFLLLRFDTTRHDTSCVLIIIIIIIGMHTDKRWWMDQIIHKCWPGNVWWYSKNRLWQQQIYIEDRSNFDTGTTHERELFRCHAMPWPCLFLFGFVVRLE